MKPLAPACGSGVFVAGSIHLWDNTIIVHHLHTSHACRPLYSLGRAQVLQQWHAILAAEIDKLDVLDAIVEENACKYTAHMSIIVYDLWRGDRVTHPNTWD